MFRAARHARFLLLIASLSDAKHTRYNALTAVTPFWRVYQINCDQIRNTLIVRNNRGRSDFDYNEPPIRYAINNGHPADY